MDGTINWSVTRDQAQDVQATGGGFWPAGSPPASPGDAAFGVGAVWWQNQPGAPGQYTGDLHDKALSVSSADGALTEGSSYIAVVWLINNGAADPGEDIMWISDPFVAEVPEGIGTVLPCVRTCVRPTILPVSGA